MIEVTIIGSGNIAFHLAKAWHKSEKVKLKNVIGRNQKSLDEFKQFANVSSDFSSIGSTAVCLLAVSDEAIGSVSEQIPQGDYLVLHTSGATNLQAISDKHRRGVFYPFQSFSKNSTFKYAEIPLLLEVGTDKDKELLIQLAESFSQNHQFLDSEQRLKLHLAGTFVNNFANHLFQIGFDLCQANKFSVELLKPLIRETADKIMHINPKEAQTGPAKRNDKDTIEKHLALLPEGKSKEIYKLITSSIQDI
ncbi:MAG: DUF2520 domain-containing protein [Bacteroidetes bacterium HGW-Bacteroidetes-13]|jgi:predicted short-subunit dehydrogenase-like oxidoreductase (DUF2520 family)|nr:MAG: DUF2520 domain-containing protein [Bacteroidetes bacterium HGW-Bacteroidetes-13]